MQVYINSLNNFLVKGRTKVRMGSRPRGEVPNRTIFNLKSGLVEPVAKLATESYKRF